MRTTVEKVYVETIDDDGRIGLASYPIRTEEGRLMINRLKRLLKIDIQQVNGPWRDPHGNESDSAHIVFLDEPHYIGLVWKRPCQLLDEIIQARIDLQNELFRLEGESDLTSANSEAVALCNLPNVEVSKMILQELELYKKIRSRIRTLDNTKDEQRKLKICESETENVAGRVGVIPAPYTW